MDGGAGIAIFIAGIVALAIVPMIMSAFRGTANQVGQAAVDAIRPAGDAPLYLLKATAKARDVFAEHTDIFLSYTATDAAALDESVRGGVEQQLMMLAFSASLLNIAVQDVAYDEGAVDRIGLIQGRNGFPKIKISDEAFLHALKSMWEPLTNDTKNVLAAHYNKFFASKRPVTGREAQLFGQFSNYTSQKLMDQFSYRMQPNTGWLDYIRCMAAGDVSGAREALF